MYSYFNNYFFGYPYDMWFNYTNSYVRILHAAPGAPAVDIYINGSKVVSNLAYKRSTSFIPVTAGRYNVRVFPAGKRENPVIDTDIRIAPNTVQTLAATGTLPNLDLFEIPERRFAKMPGMTYLRFIHLSPNAPGVDVRLENGRTIFRDVRYKEITDYAQLPPGRYTLDIYVAGTNNRVLRVPDVILNEGRVYSAYAVGLAGERPPLEALLLIDGNTYY